MSAHTSVERDGSQIACHRADSLFFRSEIESGRLADDEVARYRRLIEKAEAWIAGYECRRDEEAGK